MQTKCYQQNRNNIFKISLLFKLAFNSYEKGRTTIFTTKVFTNLKIWTTSQLREKWQQFEVQFGINAFKIVKLWIVKLVKKYFTISVYCIFSDLQNNWCFNDFWIKFRFKLVLLPCFLVKRSTKGQSCFVIMYCQFRWDWL